MSFHLDQSLHDLESALYFEIKKIRPSAACEITWHIHLHTGGRGGGGGGGGVGENSFLIFMYS